MELTIDAGVLVTGSCTTPAALPTAADAGVGAAAAVVAAVGASTPPPPTPAAAAVTR